MTNRGTLTRLLVLALGTAAVTAYAEPERPFETGWYLGGGLSYNDVYVYDDDCWGCYGNSEYGESDVGGTLTAGFRATRFLAIEGSYFSESSLRWDRNILIFDDFFDPYTVDADVDIQSYQLSVLGIAAGRYWEAYLRLGLAFWDARSNLSMTWLATGERETLLVDSSGNDLVVGIGGGRSIGDDWQIRLDYGFFPVDDRLLGLQDNYKAYTDFASLQIIRRFGQD